MYFVTLVCKNLFRRKLRSFLTGIGVAVAVGTMVALVGVANGFEQSTLDTFQKRGADIVVMSRGVPNQLSSDLPENLAEKISKLPGVKLVTPGLIDILSFGRTYVLVQGWRDDNPAFNDIEILEGQRFKPGDHFVAMIGANVASSLKKKVGDSLSVKHENFKVIALFRSFSIFDNDSIIVKLDDLQKLTRRQNSVTGFSVTLQDSRAAESVASAINTLKGSNGDELGLSALPTAQYIAQSAHIQMARAMAWLTTLIALLIGTISMANTMAMSVVERTREIGILRAIGWRKWRVIRMIIGEALFLSCAGGVVGIIGAIIACRWFTTLPQVGGFIQANVAPLVIVQGFFIALIVGLIGSIWPSWRAACMLPTEALYHE